jgi:hypothetical protein
VPPGIDREDPETRGFDAGFGEKQKNDNRARICNGSAKSGVHGTEKCGAQLGCGSEGAGCGWKRSGRRKYMIFRRLRTFFTVFHSFFTPYFSVNMLIDRPLAKSDGHKRRKQCKFKVQNAKIGGKCLAKSAKSAEKSPKSRVRGLKLGVFGEAQATWQSFKVELESILGEFDGKNTLIFMWQIYVRLVHSTARNRIGLTFESVRQTPNGLTKL